MLVSIWRKRNPRALLVEIKLVQRLWKAVWSFLSKLKLGLWFDPAILLWSVRPKETKTLTQKDTCIPMFIAVFFFYSSQDMGMEATQMSNNGWMDKEDVVYVCNEILLRYKKEGSLGIHNSMNEPWGHYTKWNASEKDMKSKITKLIV